jgi:hypothetical protein
VMGLGHGRIGCRDQVHGSLVAQIGPPSEGVLGRKDAYSENILKLLPLDSVQTPGRATCCPLLSSIFPSN